MIRRSRTAPQTLTHGAAPPYGALDSYRSDQPHFTQPEVRMRSRIPTLVLMFAVAACAGDTGEQADAESAQASMAEADEAALEQIRADYVTHYNMHHPDVVAAMYTDSAVGLWADGRIDENRADILAGLTEAMAGSPTLGLTTGETMIFGDHAITRGAYNVSMTPEGAPAPVTMTGNYMTHFVRQNGEWKINWVTSNSDAPLPEGMYAADEDSETPPDEGTMTALLTAYTTAFNAGDAAAVANLFTEDAVAAFSNLPLKQGRVAVQEAISERLAMGDSPKVEIHDVGTMELGDGWAVDGGWYTITAGATTQTGSYASLNRLQADGTWKIHWLVSNGQPMTN